MSYVIAFIVSAFLSSILIPLITLFAKRRKLFDEHDERKIHSGDIPRLGGVGIYYSFLCGFAVSGIIIGSIYPKFSIPPVFWVIFAAGFGFHMLGLVDDLKGLRARFKFVVQLALAIAVVAAGYSFQVIELPIPPYRLDLGLLGPAITVVWIIGIANAMNLIDGMDGLAGGIAFIGIGAWALLFFKTGQSLPALVAMAACGAIFGFLFNNFPPASIFMGDSGSLFLGFVLAVIPLLSNPGKRATSGLVQAITICLIPILDTFAAILRRWHRGVSFFSPDRYHLHHKLLNLGLKPRQILLILYGLCLALCASVLAGIFVNRTLSFYLMMSGWVLSGCIFVVLHFLKERGVRLIRDEEERADT